MNTDIQKRAEELYPKLKHDFFSSNTQEDIKYYQREGFIKGYSEGYDKGKEEGNQEWERYLKSDTDKAVYERDTLKQELWLKDIRLKSETSICQTLAERVKELEEHKEQLLKVAEEASRLLAENEQLKKDVTGFAEWVEDRTLYFWQINTPTTADEYLKMFKEEQL
jgi:hypothetical protein